MVVVISHKPAFLVSAQSTVVRASRQQIPAIQGRISRIRSPFTIDHPVYAALRLAYRLASSYNAWNRLCPCYGPWTLIPEIWYLKRDNAGRYAGSIAGATRVNFKEISKESRWEGCAKRDWTGILHPERVLPAKLRSLSFLRRLQWGAVAYLPGFLSCLDSSVAKTSVSVQFLGALCPLYKALADAAMNSE